jgi:hypothetical protein
MNMKRYLIPAIFFCALMRSEAQHETLPANTKKSTDESFNIPEKKNGVIQPSPLLDSIRFT